VPGHYLVGFGAPAPCFDDEGRSALFPNDQPKHPKQIIVGGTGNKASLSAMLHIFNYDLTYRPPLNGITPDPMHIVSLFLA